MKCFSEAYLTEEVYLKHERDLHKLCSGTAGCMFWRAELSGTKVAPQPCTSHLNTGTATTPRNCLLVSYSLTGRAESLTLAARPVLSPFCPAASSTKHLLSPCVHCSKPEPYESKNLLPTPASKPGDLDSQFGFARRHPNSSECRGHANTPYLLGAPLPRAHRSSLLLGHTLKANF